MALLLAVDPSITERFIQRFGVGDSRFSRGFFENMQPNSIAFTMIRGQPLAKLRGRPKGKNLYRGIFQCKSSQILAK
jgi:hypothetical protein